MLRAMDLCTHIRELERAARALDPGNARRKRLRKPVIAATERFLRRIETLKGFEEVEAAGMGLLAAPISEKGIPIEEAIELIEREVVRPGGNPASGAYLAYIPGGGLYHSALAD